MWRVKNLPQSGGVLLLGNHISWIDWLVLQAASPRAIKFVMYRQFTTNGISLGSSVFSKSSQLVAVQVVNLLKPFVNI